MTQRWLHLHLAAPLMAFGGVTIDHVGPTRDYPAASALTGLFANALGWRREDSATHQALQNRLEFAALSALPEGRHAPLIVTDTQNARLYEEEPGWTTYGKVDTRNKGNSYSGSAEASQVGNQAKRKWITHRRRRDYLADHNTHVVIRLTSDGLPSLEQLADALDRPARPLFLGRKPCLPTRRLVAGWIEADSPHGALKALAAQGITGRAIWPDDGRPYDGALKYDLPDLRNWKTGLHGGTRIICEGEIA